MTSKLLSTIILSLLILTLNAYAVDNENSDQVTDTKEAKKNLTEDEQVMLAYEKAKASGELDNVDIPGEEQEFEVGERRVPSMTEQATKALHGLSVSISSKYSELKEGDPLGDASNWTKSTYESSKKSLSKTMDNGIKSSKDLADNGGKRAKKYVTDWFDKTWEDAKAENEKNKMKSTKNKDKKRKNHE